MKKIISTTLGSLIIWACVIHTQGGDPAYRAVVLVLSAIEGMAFPKREGVYRSRGHIPYGGRKLHISPGFARGASVTFEPNDSGEFLRSDNSESTDTAVGQLTFSELQESAGSTEDLEIVGAFQEEVETYSDYGDFDTEEPELEIEISAEELAAEEQRQKDRQGLGGASNIGGFSL